MTHWIETFATPPEGYVYREFRREDGIMEGVEIDHPITGGTMEKDGEPVAYAGVNLIAGRHWVFFFIKDDSIRRHGLWIVRLIRDSIVACKRAGITELYGLCDTSKPNAEVFMRKLGFVPLPAMAKTSDMILYEKLMGGQAKTWVRREAE